MPNVLYVGHYKENSGWGQVTRDQILSLDTAGYNIVTRSIDLGLANAEVPNRILELEKGDIKECSIIIQHVLPHYMKYDNHFKQNIGMFEFETQNIAHTQWVDHLNIMDKVFVPCTDMLSMCGVETLSFYVPHACDVKEYGQKHESLMIPSIQNKFVFYFIGTYNRRKHLAALVRAFHTEFDPIEPVELVIKTNRANTSPEDLASEVLNLCASIKDNLRLYNDRDRYKKEVIITVDLPRDELLRLHKSCDCFVCPSFGEAWCAPAMDAMGMSNIVIAGNTGGPKDYIDSGTNGLLVDGTFEPVFGEHESFDGFGTARELEFDISVSHLQQQMRRAYHLNHVQNTEMRTLASQTAAMYSYSKIGTKMRTAINV